jgi:hypothetical protein
MLLLTIIKECLFFSQVFANESTSSPCQTLPPPCSNNYAVNWYLTHQPIGSNPFTPGTYVFDQPGTYVFQQIERIEEEGQSHTAVIGIDTFEIGVPPDLYEETYLICYGDTFAPLPNTFTYGNAVWDTFPTQTQSYIVFTLNAYCQAVEEFVVLVEACGNFAIPSPDDYGIYIPNVFSPNGDGINDTFEVYAVGYHLQSIEIYNRWGGLVSAGKTWTGDNCEQGNYAAKVTILIDGEPIEFHTPVTLIK